MLLHGHVRASKTTPDGRTGRGALRSVGRNLWRRDGDRAAALSRHRDRRRRQRRAGVAVGGVAAPGGKIPALATNTLQTVGSRLQETHTRVVEMSTQQVEQRVAHALLRLAKQSGRKVEHGIEIDFPISRQDIAK